MRTRKTHCPKGHEYNEVNSYYTRQGWPLCRLCKRASDKKRRDDNPEIREDNIRRAKEWRDANPGRSRELALAHYDKIRARIEEAKSAPCVDCGGTFPFYVMDFDHRDPKKKKFNIGLSRSLKALEEEIAKCDLVCANCHRIRTWEGRTRTCRRTE